MGSCIQINLALKLPLKPYLWHVLQLTSWLDLGNDPKYDWWFHKLFKLSDSIHEASSIWWNYHLLNKPCIKGYIQFEVFIIDLNRVGTFITSQTLTQTTHAHTHTHTHTHAHTPPPNLLNALANTSFFVAVILLHIYTHKYFIRNLSTSSSLQD